ncbi:hypothetical protein [Blastococcus sp. SYSU D00813]
MRIPARWFAEPITVETHQGQGAYGDTFSDPVTVLGHVSGGRRLQRSAAAEEVVSQRQVLLPNPARLADGSGTVDPVEVLTPESRVTAATVVATVGQVTPHVQPGTGAVVYVSGELT